jgi:chemotaxis protein methyltransferase CheR
MNAEDFRFLADLLRRRSGLALTPDKSYLIESRLAPVARKLDLSDVPELVRRLRTREDERTVALVVDAMTTNESFFFRDGRPFEQFAQHMLPALLRARQATRKLAIWSAAAATGQEPYSLALCLEDRARELQGWQIEILATDISPSALDRAREGRYTQFEVQRGLPVKRLVQGFTQERDGWVVKPELKRWIRFAPLNLLDLKPTFGRFDVIFCRNVLIYFDVPTKQRVVETMAQMVPPDGFFVLGGTETILGVTNRFTQVPDQRGVFRPAGTTAPIPAGQASRAVVG